MSFEIPKMPSPEEMAKKEKKEKEKLPESEKTKEDWKRTGKEEILEPKKEGEEKGKAEERTRKIFESEWNRELTPEEEQELQKRMDTKERVAEKFGLDAKDHEVGLILRKVFVEFYDEIKKKDWERKKEELEKRGITTEEEVEKELNIMKGENALRRGNIRAAFEFYETAGEKIPKEKYKELVKAGDDTLENAYKAFEEAGAREASAAIHHELLDVLKAYKETGDKERLIKLGETTLKMIEDFYALSMISSEAFKLARDKEKLTKFFNTVLENGYLNLASWTYKEIKKPEARNKLIEAADKILKKEYFHSDWPSEDFSKMSQAIGAYEAAEGRPPKKKIIELADKLIKQGDSRSVEEAEELYKKAEKLE